MPNIEGSYDQNAEASADFSPIPSGNYRARITESAIEDISKNTNYGRCLVLTWQIETGPYDGRLVWQRVNMYAENMTNNDKVINIANSQFASIRQATGKVAPRASEELHNIPCEIYVGLTKPQPGYSQRNEVKSVKPIGGATGGNPPAQRQAPAPQQRQAAGQSNAGGSAPWRRTG